MKCFISLSYSHILLMLTKITVLRSVRSTQEISIQTLTWPLCIILNKSLDLYEPQCPWPVF